MPDILYKSFLADASEYNLAEAYWRRFFRQFFDSRGIPFQNFYNKHFGNGQKIYDANPIFDAYFPLQHKLVRIIQFLPEPDDLLLVGWVDYFPASELDDDQKPNPKNASHKDDPIPEFVLSLVMTKENLAQVKKLLQHWILEDISGEDMDKILKALN